VRIFYLNRTVDETGVSGTGYVAEGIEFRDGTVAMRWFGELASTAMYGSIEDLIAIHGHGGKTQIVWWNAPPSMPGAASISTTRQGLMAPVWTER